MTSRLVVRNLSRKTVVVLGYEGEPFLRFGHGGVFRNERSLTANLDRTNVRPPASRSARPRWARVAAGTSFGWHDRRIEWFGPNLPEVVRKHPAESVHLRDWSIRGRADGKPFAIVGFLGYAPSPGGGDDGGRPVLATVIGSILAVVAAALLVWRRRARRPSGRRAPFR